MARIPEQQVTRLKTEVSIVRLVEAAGVELKKHGGADLIGRCPFHDGRTPSLVVPGSIVNCSQASHSNYTYGSSRPHAVTQAGNRAFTYDNNGNVVEDLENGNSKRRFVYTSFDLLRRVSSNGRHTEFHYGGNRARMLRRELSGTTVTERVHYIGSTEVIWPGANPGTQQATFRRDVAGVALVTVAANGQAQVRYPHRGHLGSVVAISDAFGQVVARMGFDAWGARRDVESPSQRWLQWLNPFPPAWAGPMLDITPRGYTGHEHVDDHGIIHMNGRIYDPLLARFLQADPFIEDTGTLNRYTYVHNNPLAFTDPSGYISFGIVGRAVKRAVRSVMRALGPTVTQIGLAIGCGYVAGPGGAAACMGIGNYELTRAMGGSRSDALRAGAIAGVTSAAFNVAGEAIGGAQRAGKITAGQAYGLKVIAHGTIGGVQHTLQGGKFGHGFASAGLPVLAGPGIMQMRQAPVRTAMAAVVGGTASVITGGRFSNGAATAAMMWAYNHERQRRNHIALPFEGANLDDWQFVTTVSDTSIGGQFIFDAGNEIVLEFRSDAAPLPTHQWSVNVIAQALAIDGSVVTEMATPRWFEPVTHTVMTGLSNIGPRLHLKAGLPSPGGHRWFIQIPPQKVTHGNFRNRWINVYQRRTGP